MLTLTYFLLSSGLYSLKTLVERPLHLDISSNVTVLSISIIFHSYKGSEFTVKPYFSGSIDINISETEDQNGDHCIMIILSDQGPGVKEEEIKAIHGPIGINLGGKSPPEIALSIISEIVLEHYKSG